VLYLFLTILHHSDWQLIPTTILSSTLELVAGMGYGNPLIMEKRSPKSPLSLKLVRNFDPDSVLIPLNV
jgi:hypothetical protein